jgi:anaerobic magnesium-protoporphyrin IX monomethyl ester cyclase
VRILLQSFSFLSHNGNYNIGALFLKAALASRPDLARDFEVEVLQSDYFDDLDEIAATIRARAPDVVGLSVFLWSLDLTATLLRKLDDGRSRPWIIGGGSGLTHDAESFLAQNPAMDLVVRGAGEQAFLDLLVARRDGGEVSEVAGITYRAVDGAIRVTPDRRLELDLRLLPSPYGLDYVHPSVQPRFLHLETERYCPYRCSYCTWAKSRTAAGERQFSLERVAQEIDWARQHRFATVNFFDSALNYDSERFTALLDILDRPRSSGHETTYFFFLGLDFLDQAQLRRLQAVRTHCLVFIGVESFSVEALRLAHRADHLARLPGLLAALSANPYLQVMVGLILGLPGDNLDAFTRGLDLLEGSPRVHAMVSLLAVTPGTPLRAQAAEHGMELAAAGVPFLRHSHDFPATDLECAFARINERAADERASLNPLSVPISRLTNPEIVPVELRGTPDRWVRVGVVGIADGRVTGSGVYAERDLQR